MNKTCARCQKVVYPIEELKCLDKVSSCLQFVFISIRHPSSVIVQFSRPPLLCYCYSCFCRRRCCLCSLPIFGSCEFVYTDVFVCGLCVCAVCARQSNVNWIINNAQWGELVQIAPMGHRDLVQKPLK